MLDDLTNQANIMSRRLNAAQKLIKGLGREQERWTNETVKLQENTVKLIGDCLTCSSFLSYSGPFDFNYRNDMVYGSWRKLILENDIPCTKENFRIEDLLTTNVEIS